MATGGGRIQLGGLTTAVNTFGDNLSVDSTSSIEIGTTGGVAAPTITFDGANGGVGILDLTSTTLANFHGVIANFTDSDQIKVANATRVSLNSTGKILTVRFRLASSNQQKCRQKSQN